MTELNKEIKLTKKEVEKRNKIFEFLSMCWERIEEDSPRYSELVKIGDWKSPEHSAWSYKLGEAHKSDGIKELNIWVGFEPAEKGKKDYDLKLMSEEEDKTIQEYLLIYRGGRLSSLDNEMGGCALFNRINQARRKYLNDLAEQNEQEDLKTLGYEAYVDKKIAEDYRLKDKETDDEEKKERHVAYRKIVKDLLMKYQWNIGDWISGLYDELKKIESKWEKENKYFHDSMIKNIVEEIINRHWNIHSKAINKTENELFNNQTEKYHQLAINVRDKNNDMSSKDFYKEVGLDIQKVHSDLGYSVEALADNFGEWFFRRWMKKIDDEEFEARKNWSEQQWKEYFPKEYWTHKEIRVQDLSYYDFKRFIEDKQYTNDDFNKENEGKYTNDDEGLNKKYCDYKKEVLNRLKSVKDSIFESKNFTYSCEYCSEETKSNPEYKFVTRTKHNIIYTCSRCENSDYYITIKKWEGGIKISENQYQNGVK